VSYEVRLSNRASRDLDRLGQEVLGRVFRRLEQLAEAPYNPRFSTRLTNRGELRKSRVGGWRIIFFVDETGKALQVVTVERRGQVYRRI